MYWISTTYNHYDIIYRHIRLLRFAILVFRKVRGIPSFPSDEVMLFLCFFVSLCVMLIMIVFFNTLARWQSENWPWRGWSEKRKWLYVRNKGREANVHCSQPAHKFLLIGGSSDVFREKIKPVFTRGYYHDAVCVCIIHVMKQCIMFGVPRGIFYVKRITCSKNHRTT